MISTSACRESQSLVAHGTTGVAKHTQLLWPAFGFRNVCEQSEYILEPPKPECIWRAMTN
eukprot:7819135-Lingulodinium_polyedra.AAC.1